jgi:hypothetical protein
MDRGKGFAGMKYYKWIRVTKKDRCKICEKPDYCTYAPEAGLALCMRVESDRPSNNSMGGWLHKTGDGYTPRYIAPIRKAIEDPPLDAERIWRRWFDKTNDAQRDVEGVALGVDTDALTAIGMAWANKEWQLDLEKRPHATPAWTFPMRSAEGQVVGIRCRGGGAKWAVKGSRQGLFLPDPYLFDFEGTLWIVEGPTDLAAALSLGLYAIGRPSCQGQEDLVLKIVRRLKARRVVIVTDNDAPDIHGRIAGLDGAAKLQSMLPVMHCLYIPPVKDIREFLNRGGNRRMIEASIKDLVWERPRRDLAA